MTAVFRIVSLIGVMSAGFYVLYLTQARMSEPQSLTENVSGEPAQVTLGDEGELSALGDAETPWKTAEADSLVSASGGPGGDVATEMFTASSDPAATIVSDDAPDSAGGLDFRDAERMGGEGSGSDLGIVRAAMESSEPEVITLTGDENPFDEDTPPQPSEAEQPSAFESIDPFDAQNPFENQPAESDKPAPQPETEPAEFDPFGEDVKAPEPFTAEKSSAEKAAPTPAEEFPGLESKPAAPGPATSNTNDAAEPKQPAPSTGDAPFLPFTEEPPKETNETEAVKPAGNGTPAVSEDPFPDFTNDTNPMEKEPVAPKPVPASDPFGEPFPELQPAAANPIKPVEKPTLSDDPFGVIETKPEPEATTPAAFPDLPGGLPATDKPKEEAPRPQPADPLDSGFDPFADDPPGPGPAESEKPQPSPSASEEFPPFDQPDNTPTTETPPDRSGSLPSLDAFPDLDEKLKKRVQDDELSREESPFAEPSDEFSPEDPASDPEREAPRELPDVRRGMTGSDESPSPEELKSAPTGIVPSMSDLQGDGVLTPETPRQVQLPYLEIHKNAPPKALLKQPFVYTILVKNVGEAAANEVTVQDQIPKGTNLTGTIPQAELVGRRLVWNLGRIEPGQEQKVAVRVVPVESGPIGSVATVNFVAEVGAETVVEQSDVTFQMTLPEQANVGEVVECRFEIQNKGKQIVSGIVLRDIIPEGLHHPAGNDLENLLGDLKPGEKISEALEMKVMKAGEHLNQAVLTAEGGLELKQEARLEAAGNRLVILRRGPKERFVGRPAIYQNMVKNSSQEPVRDAIVIEKLPEAMQFVQAGQGGQYHAASREIYWKIVEIGPGRAVTLDVQLTPTKAGNGESLVRVRESQGKEIQAVSHTQIRSYSSIGLEVSQFEQPILVGDTVVMRVEATNRGNASANTVQLRAKIPPTLQLMAVRGKTRFKVEGRDVVFETLQAMPPGASEIIELELQAADSDKAEVAVSVQSKGMSRPLVKTTALPVYSRR